MQGWAVLYWIVALGLFAVWVARRVQSRRAQQTHQTSALHAPPDRSTGPVVGPDADLSARELRTSASPATEPLASDKAPAEPTGTDRPSEKPASPAEKVWPAPPPPDPNDNTYRLDPDDPTQSTPSPSDESTTGITGSEATSDMPAAQSTLPELLAGITLPHELVPLTQIDAPLDLATHIVVHTQKATAEVVRAGLCEELERLGYDVEQDSVTELTATGPRGVVLVEIHPDGASVQDAGSLRFPTAGERSVVVELRAG